MSGVGGINLSGRWTGLFSYPIFAPPVKFEAVLQDVAGLVTGVTTELGDTLSSFGQTRNAVIDGQREGVAVRFLKMYDEADGEYDVVHYDGIVSADGNEIEGNWAIPDEWSGTFLMIRASGQGEELAIEAQAPIEIRR